MHSCSGPSPTSPPRHPLWPNDAHLRQRYVDSRKRGEGVPHAACAVPLFPCFFFLLLACCHRVALGAGSGSAPRACLCGLSRMRAARTTKKPKTKKKAQTRPDTPENEPSDICGRRGPGAGAALSNILLMRRATFEGLSGEKLRRGRGRRGGHRPPPPRQPGFPKGAGRVSIGLLERWRVGAPVAMTKRGEGPETGVGRWGRLRVHSRPRPSACGYCWQSDICHPACPFVHPRHSPSSPRLSSAPARQGHNKARYRSHTARPHAGPSALLSIVCSRLRPYSFPLFAVVVLACSGNLRVFVAHIFSRAAVFCHSRA